MTYSKPEIEVLGDAARLVQGNKTSPTPDAGSLADQHDASDCEVDD